MHCIVLGYNDGFSESETLMGVYESLDYAKERLKYFQSKVRNDFECYSLWSDYTVEQIDKLFIFTDDKTLGVSSHCESQRGIICNL